MDIAYDHIQEENFPEDHEGKSGSHPAGQSLNDEFQEAMKAVSASPWGAKLGGLWGGLVKQGESYYNSAQAASTSASTQASKGVTDLWSRARSLSLGQALSSPQNDQDGATTPTVKTRDPDEHPDKPESLPADIVKEAQSMVSKFRSEAAKRLKDIEKAEDAADEALLRFGNNLKGWFSDAITVVAPPDDATGKEKGQVLFESKDADGKRVIHTTRLDAQLYVIHSSLDSFLNDPSSPKYAAWADSFDAEKRTQDIAKDLEKYPELKRAMEKSVPEKVDYKTFWSRYYFLRNVVESEEVRRKEMLKGASAEAQKEEVGWGSDESSEEEDEEEDEEDDEDESDDDDTDNAPTPNVPSTTLPPKPAQVMKPAAAKAAAAKAAAEKAAAAKPAAVKPAAINSKKKIDDKLNPTSPRRSDDLVSRPDSDASYDLVSGANSRAPGTPKDEKRPGNDDESDEEDWE